MNTLYLKYAVEVEKTRSITQAAENLFMAQPNLSKAIRELEESLGITIFQRTSKGVAPTAKGAEILRQAREILSRIDKLETSCRTDDPTKQRFGLSIPRGSYISVAFTRFAETLDPSLGMELSIRETNSLDTIQAVSEGRFRMGIIRYKLVYESYFQDFLAEKNLVSDPIWEFEYLALMSRRNPLAEVPEVTPEALSSGIRLVHGDESVPYLMTSEAGETNLRTLYVFERGSQFDLLSHLPTSFMWVSPIPQELLDRYELIQRRCAVPNNRSKDLIIHNKGYKFSELDRKFIDKLYEAKNEVAYRDYR